MSSQQKRILVLGSNGRVGRLLQRAWKLNPPTGLTLIFQSRSGDGVNWQPGQPSPFGQLDAIISLWGVTRGTAEELSANTSLALEAQSLGAQAGARRVLHCSSVAVYAPKDGRLTESDPVGPLDAYGRAKLDMENALARTPGPSPIVLRIGSVAGAESLAASVRRGCKDPVELDRFANGAGPERSYIAPTDLANVLLGLACRVVDLPDVINVGAPNPVSMDSLLIASGVLFTWRPAPPAARQSVVMDCRLLCSLLDLPPGVSDPAHIAKDWAKLEALE